MIIHGDNLHGLKAIMPRYAGRVNCIYIDPPYNTGNEGWAYNDNVNSPLMREWLQDKSPVDGEDLERHDKWLCMMWPRVQLLRELLAEDGGIFVSIDDNEVHHLRMMMDEVFGERNFVATIIWEKVYSPKSSAKYFSENHDFIVAYAKNKEAFKLGLLPRTEEADARYTNPDNDSRGLWKTGGLDARNSYSKGTYSIRCPGGRMIKGPPLGSFWRYSEENFWELHRDNRIWWGENQNQVPAIKRFLTEVKQGLVPETIWTYKEVGHTQDAKKTILQIFPEDIPDFTTKPVNLVRRIIDLSTDKHSIVLDSFAGSGTTAHAVMALNKEDGGARKFILVECEPYADTITAERVRRVMRGVPTAKAEALKAGLGGSFTYCTLGEVISSEKMLTGETLPDYNTLARHLVYNALGHAPVQLRKVPGKDGLFHETDDRLFYLVYKPDLSFLRGADSALNGARAERIAKQAKQKKKTAVVFATHKFMGQKELSQMRIVFCGLPYDQLKS